HPFIRRSLGEPADRSGPPCLRRLARATARAADGAAPSVSQGTGRSGRYPRGEKEMNAIGASLVWCIVQVTLLAGLAWVVYALVRRSGPPVRALAAFAGLIMIAGLTAFAFSPWPRWRIGTDDVLASGNSSGDVGQTAAADESQTDG